ncbi:hypothetical protein HUU42_12630 [bacterium]|nr:hypothetical protein [bacterium]
MVIENPAGKVSAGFNLAMDVFLHNLVNGKNIGQGDSQKTIPAGIISAGVILYFVGASFFSRRGSVCGLSYSD